LDIDYKEGGTGHVGDLGMCVWNMVVQMEEGLIERKEME
jgi:hypothetical protein